MNASNSIISAILITLLAALTLAAEPAPKGEPEAAAEQPAVTAEQVSAWIADLGSPRFVVREEATKALLRAGRPALDPLGKVALGEEAEPAERAIWVLRRFANSRNESLHQPALEYLVRVKDRPTLVAWADSRLVGIRHEKALVKVAKLGGHCLPEGAEERLGRYLNNRVVLDKDWKGGDDGLRHVADLVGFPIVQIVGTEISPEGVRHLKKMQGLTELQLYRTRITPEQVEELDKEFPQLDIDYRRGALLGVAGSGDTPPALIQHVQPESAAEEAGLQVGDVVVKLDGRDVGSFEQLTDLIAEFEPGDEVELEIMRGEKRLTKTVQFGSW